jgi:hypothetical protein
MGAFVIPRYFSEIINHVWEKIRNAKINGGGGESVLKREPEIQTPL